MKKLLTTVLVLFLALQSFAQLTYFNRTGEGFSITGSHSSDTHGNYSASTIGGMVSDRITRAFSVNIQFVTTTVESYYTGKKSGNALIPSLTIQIPNDRILGIAAHVGYANNLSTKNIPTILLGLEIYHRINSEGVLQLIPHLSVGKSVLLEETYYNPDPVFGIGAKLAIRLGKHFFLLGGPQMNFSDGHEIVSVNCGLVAQ